MHAKKYFRPVSYLLKLHIAALALFLAICLTIKPSHAEQAYMADRFVDGLGVNTHLPFTPYSSNYSSIIKPMLQQLGVRHIRDEETYSDPNTWNLENDLASTLGIHCDLILEPTYLTVAQALSTTKANLLGCQEAVEGPNEWEHAGSGWMATDNTYTQQIKTQFGGDAQTTNMTINGFSLVAGTNDTNNYVAAYGNYSSYVNYGNAHLYTTWTYPEVGAMESLLAGCAPLWGSAPYIVSESGYFTGTASGNVDAIVQGKYIPRSLFTAFNDGAYRTYLYELYDESADQTNEQSNYGLVYNNGSVKPAFSAVQNLISLLSDRGSSFTPGSLTWSINGDTANVKHTLLQKRDGSFWLALWVGVASNDTTISQAVTLMVPASVTSATQYMIHSDGTLTSAQLTLSNNQCSFNVNDIVSLVKLGTGGVSSPPTGLTATAGNSQVLVSWTSSSGATSYNVYRGTSAGGESGTPIATGITGTSYTDTGVTNGTTYYYEAAAVNSAGTSGLSKSEASATPQASVSIAFVQGKSNYSSSSVSHIAATFGSNVKSGDLIVVATSEGTTVKSVTDSQGNSYSLAVTSSTGHDSIYYAKSSSVGRDTVTIKLNSSVAYPNIRILEYSGVSTLDKTSVSAGASTTSSTGPVSTTVANELLFGANSVVSTGTSGPGTGYTQRMIDGDGNIAEDEIVSATGSYSASAALTGSSAWTMMMATFR